MIYLIITLLVLSSAIFIKKQRIQTIEKIIVKEIIKEVPVEIIKEVEVIKEIINTEKVNLEYHSGNLVIDGDLIVEGFLDVKGEITCFKKGDK